MVEFKKVADEIIKREFGIQVEHLYATRNGEKLTYEKLFYHVPKRKTQDFSKKKFREEGIDGWQRRGGGCGATSMLKRNALRIPIHRQLLAQETQGRNVSSAFRWSEGTGVPATSSAGFSSGPFARGAKKNIVKYLGIAADEPERIARHDKPGFLLPLVAIGWDEAKCRQICEEHGLLSPIYTSATRGGVGFVTIRV